MPEGKQVWRLDPKILKEIKSNVTSQTIYPVDSRVNKMSLRDTGNSMLSVMNATSGQKLAVRVADPKDEQRALLEKEVLATVSQIESKGAHSSEYYQTLQVMPGGSFAKRSKEDIKIEVPRVFSKTQLSDKKSSWRGSDPSVYELLSKILTKQSDADKAYQSLVKIRA